jgi:hypothetical protein
LKVNAVVIRSISLVLALWLISGVAWSEDSGIVTSLKDTYNSLKEKLSPLKEKFNIAKVDLKPLNERFNSLNEKLEPLKKYISFENRLDYQYRSVGGDEDSDIYEYWNLRGRDLYDGVLDFYFSGRLSKDIDGTSDSAFDDSFVSGEGNDSAWQDQVYQLYATYNDPKHRFRLRLGRQYIDDVGWLHIDGGFLKLFEREKISGSLFFGQPVSYYNSGADNWAGGYALKLRLWKGNKIKLTYVRYEDDSTDEDDDLSTIDVWQRLGEHIRAHGHLSFLDDRFRMLGGDLFYVSPDGFFDLFFKVTRSGDLSKESNEYSPLSGVLGNREESTFLSLRGTFTIKSWLRVSPGISSRLVDESDRDDRNREFANYDLTFNVTPHEHWSTSLTGNYWSVSEDDNFFGLTGEIDYHPSKTWNFTVGTAYREYKYTAEISTSDNEISPDVYTLYASTKVNITKSMSIKVQLETESNSFESDNSVRLRTSLTTRF